MVRLVFLGTPSFACPSLRALVEGGHEVALVVSQPDRVRGRRAKPTPSPVRALARELGLANTTLERGERVALYQRVLDLSPEVVVVVAFGHILREPLLSGAPHGCVNLHASLLPRWRGPAPIHRAIVAGDRETGVCTMRLEAGVDTGPVYLCERTPIGEDETAGMLHDRLAELGGALLGRTIDGLADGSVRARPQSAEGVTHAPLLRREEGTVDFARDAGQVHDRIRGLHPWPGIAVRWGESVLKLAASRRGAPGERAGAPGTILRIDEGGMEVACRPGSVWIQRVQAAGGRPVAPADYARGHDLSVGQRLLPLEALGDDA